MVEFAFIQSLLISLALGALIGLEREYAQYRKRGHDYAGIRTFPLIAVFGTVSAFLGQIYSIYILVVAMLLVGFLIITAYFVVNRKGSSKIGATSEVAGFLTFFIGVLVYNRQVSFAILLTVIVTIILFSRSFLHEFAKKISEEEMGDTLKFALIAFVILPLLPNQGYGPHELFNPYIIWLMVVFISGIGFIGYVMLKWIGERGITLAGILGGLVSSTATTTSFADRSKKSKKLFKPLALGVILANGIMFIRILIEVFVLNRDLFFDMLIPLLTLAFITAIFSYFLWRKAADTKGKIELESPFRLKPALKFGIFFAIILALVKLADVYLSNQGVYLVSFISGFADVDAITVSLSQLARGDMAQNIARNGIIIATLTNVAVKGGIAWWLGGKQFSRIVVSLFVVLILVGIGFLFLL